MNSGADSEGFVEFKRQSLFDSVSFSREILDEFRVFVGYIVFTLDINTP